MKRIISSFVIVLLCTTLSAQEKLNFFELVVDVIDNNLSNEANHLFTVHDNEYFTYMGDDEKEIVEMVEKEIIVIYR
jgi:hypothetical protein